MNRTLMSGLLAAAAIALAGSAGAQPDQPIRDICLDPGGHSEPIACSATGGRTRASENVCTCPAGSMKYVAPVCPEGVKPPPESLAYDRARKAAVSDGSLVGDVFEGAPMCVAPLRM
jgi:hypothetical protein